MASFSFSNKFMHGVLLAGLLGVSTAHQVQAVPIEQGSLTQSGNSAVTTGTVASNDQGSTLWQLYQQVQQLQQELRELRGQLESQQNSLDRTQKEVNNRYTDLDQRLELLKEQTQPAEENSADSPDTESPTPAAADSNVPASNPADTPEPAAAPEAPAVPEAPAAAPPSAVSTAAASGTSSSENTAIAATANDQQADKQAYISAYDAYKAGGAAKAIQPMQKFIASFPRSVYVPNAYYWLGEFYLASNPADFVKAKKSFNEVIDQYPKSAKASTALYRVATITQEIDKRTSEATALMNKLLRDYPRATEAQYARTFIAAHP